MCFLVAFAWCLGVLLSSAAAGGVTLVSMHKLKLVLCRPSGPQNVGAIARVALNFGLKSLSLVGLASVCLRLSALPPHYYVNP